MSQPSQTQPARWLLPSIVLIYLILGTLYAVCTPAWQTPDEPAHYNYLQYLADQHRFPVLKAGDYPAAYLEAIKAAKFPPEMSISPIRYEFHQPPLYYVLAVPIYRLFDARPLHSALLPLRLLSVALGALLLLVVHWTVQELAPNRPYLALGATALVAFLPMHLAMTAAANNDTLAELLLATILLLAIRYLRWGGVEFRSPESTGEEMRLLVLLGITTGLGFLTKSYVYVAPALVLLAIIVRYFWLDKASGSILDLLKAGSAYLLPAIALGFPWWLRNIALYGSFDFLGLGRHDQVVVGQLRTAEFITRYGMAQLLRDFLLTSFRSFWGQFGWMGVLLDERIYQALAILAALALFGFTLWALGAWRRRAQFARWQLAAGGLLALSGLFTVASYIWYNTNFVQHQGRYLFPALVPLSLAMALGWREVLRRERALLVAAVLLAGAAILRLAGLLSNWPLLMLGGAAVIFGIRRLLPGSWDPFAQAIPYLLLVPLDLACLFLFIVPQLAL